VPSALGRRGWAGWLGSWPAGVARILAGGQWRPGHRPAVSLAGSGDADERLGVFRLFFLFRDN
jgi:hypothetical protein